MNTVYDVRPNALQYSTPWKATEFYVHVSVLYYKMTENRRQLHLI